MLLPPLLLAELLALPVLLETLLLSPDALLDCEGPELELLLVLPPVIVTWVEDGPTLLLPLDALELAPLDDCDEAAPLPLGVALELACDDDAELLPDVGVVLCVLPLTDTLTPVDWLLELLEAEETDAVELADVDDADALPLALLTAELL